MCKLDRMFCHIHVIASIGMNGDRLHRADSVYKIFPEMINSLEFQFSKTQQKSVLLHIMNSGHSSYKINAIVLKMGANSTQFRISANNLRKFSCYHLIYYQSIKCLV